MISNMRIVSFKEALKKKSRGIVIAGAGNYGKRIYYLLRKEGIQDIVFGDNNSSKANIKYCGCIVRLLDELMQEAKEYTWFIPIRRYMEGGYGLCVYQQIIGEICEDNIVLVDVETLYSNSDEEGIEKTRNHLLLLLSTKKEKEHLKEICNVKSIVFRKRSHHDIANGPSGVMRTQQVLLKCDYHDLRLGYYWSDEDDLNDIDLDFREGEIVNGIEFGRRMSKEAENTIFIAHDIFSAAGLALEGKHYALIYHQQGEALFEKRILGLKIYDEIESIIKQFEILAVKNADIVGFPSKGAGDFFWATGQFEGDIGNCINVYEALYNTLNESLLKKTKKIIDTPEVGADVQTFLSIGQMTESKGLDRVADFLNRYTKETNRAVRWIVVGDGVMKKKVLLHMNHIMKNNRHVSCIQYDKVSHEEINYLFSISNAYIMLHRVSIFDIATLEAMYNNLSIILSDIDGNKEFNRDNNVFLINELDNVDYNKIDQEIINHNSHNREVYNEVFNNSAFEVRYKKLIDDLYKKSLG